MPPRRFAPATGAWVRWCASACLLIALLPGCTEKRDSRETVTFWVMGFEGEQVARLLPEFGAVVAPNGELRMLPNLQRLIDRGLKVGYVHSREWVHLGGTLPSAEENVRAVARRLWSEERG